MTKKTESPIVFNAQVEKPKVKRPRAGTWTPFSKQIPIPGTGRGAAALAKEMGPFHPDSVRPCGPDPDIADLEMYAVEFMGETLEVQRNRAGVKRANDWIRGIKRKAEHGVKVNRIVVDLEEMIVESTDAETVSRAKAAIRMLIGQTADGV